MKGFDTYCFYIGTGDVETCRERIQIRAEQGRLAIPDQYIEPIRNASLSNLPAATEAFNTISIYDNSKKLVIPEKVMVIHEQQIAYKKEQIPDWVRESLGPKYNLENNMAVSQSHLEISSISQTNSYQGEELAKKLNYRDYQQMVTFSEKLNQTRQGVTFYASQDLKSKKVYVWNDHSFKSFAEFDSWRDMDKGLK